MKAKSLYQNLEYDFIKDNMSDDWAPYMWEIKEYITPEFMNRSMWLVCDFASEITYVFSAVFPSSKILSKINKLKIKNALLFVHHPSTWDIRNSPNVFIQIKREELDQLKNNNIWLYNLHVPLDHYWEYSTSVNLAKALWINPIWNFAPYFWAMAWVIWTSQEKSILWLQKTLSEQIWFNAKLYNYWTDNIMDWKVAIIAGWWLTEWIAEVIKLWINTLVTWISAKNEFTQNSHDLAQKHWINILWGTHYATEKFACIKILDYFKNFWLNWEFIEDDAILEDL